MDRIQELIDERRADLPTGLAKELLELCQKESLQERLFNVTTVRIVAHPYGDCDCDSHCCDLRPIGQRHILKAKRRASHPTYISEQGWLDMGYIDESWIDAKMPKVLQQAGGCITILHDVKRRVPKRTRAVVESEESAGSAE